MQHKLGTHWIKTHGRPEDLKFIRDLQPPSVKLVAGDVPDPQWISDVYSAAPNTLIVLRSWAMSEQKSDMAADPAGTGKRHAREWSGHIERLRTEAKRRNLPFPATEQLVVLGINEPEVWTHLQQTVDYTVAFLDACKKLALTAGALNLSVGGRHSSRYTPPLSVGGIISSCTNTTTWLGLARCGAGGVGAMSAVRGRTCALSSVSMALTAL